MTDLRDRLASWRKTAQVQAAKLPPEAYCDVPAAFLEALLDVVSVVEDRHDYDDCLICKALKRLASIEA